MLKERHSEETVQEVWPHIKNVLQNKQASFLPGADLVLKRKITEYAHELGCESIKIARQHQADIVSPAYVERASENLFLSKNKCFFRRLGAIGGILLGASLSSILGMAMAERYSALGILVSVALAIVGVGMVAFHFAKDR